MRAGKVSPMPEPPTAFVGAAKRRSESEVQMAEIKEDCARQRRQCIEEQEMRGGSGCMPYTKIRTA